MAGKAIVRPVFRSTDDRLAPGVWDPRLLFVKGEQGALYDPSDLSTLFQDAAGTTPVTADGDPVGLMLDKSPNGNHATQSVAAARPVYQRGDSRGVVNLLEWSEDIVAAGWGEERVAIDSNAAPPPISGGGGAELVRETTDTGVHRISLAGPITNGATFSFSVYARAGGRDYLNINTGSSLGVRATFDLNAGTVTGTTGSSSIIDAGGGWWRCSVSGVGTAIAAVFIQINKTVTGSGDDSYTGDGTSGIYVWGAQLEEGSTATTYQRNDSHLGGVGTGSTDDLHWLADDKVDDVMTATLPAMPTATVATATDDGVVINYPVNIPAGAYSVDTTSTQGFDYGRVIVDRQLTAPEQTTLTTYLEDKS